MHTEERSNGAKKRRSKKLTMAQLKNLIAPFLAANPTSSLEEIGSGRSKAVAVFRPWNDPSLILRLSKFSKESLESLNQLFLPEPYSGIYHRDTKRFEIAWTAFVLSKPMKELVDRTFEFNHKKSKYKCSFSKSTERLLTVASMSLPLQPSSTQYRNLPSFFGYVQNQEKLKEKQKFEEDVSDRYGDPISFFIEGLEWDEQKVLELCITVNFYLRYFDSVSPVIVIHDTTSKKAASSYLPRYSSEKFPAIINAQAIDENLLNFWQASTVGDSGRRFVYSYRIMEYASHAYMRVTEKAEIKKLLSRPDALDNLDDLIRKVLGKIQDDRQTEIPRFNNFVCEVINPELLWKFLEKNNDVMSKEIKMEGGYCIPPLVSKTTTLDAFKTNGLQSFATTIRHVRNHLSHGRDQTSGHVIAPTSNNFEKLEPWAALISLAANEVMLYTY